MALADPNSRAVGYLILRHLYDGDIIEWPIDEDHPSRQVFEDLEQQGLIARWDRVWPLHDRYRLTESGIAAIEAVYRPEGAEGFFDQLRQRNLNPQDRRGFIASQGFDPVLWPLLHDPSTHWSTYQDLGSPYSTYVWEDQQAPRRTRHQHVRDVRDIDDGSFIQNTDYDDSYQRGQMAGMLVDLDNTGGGNDYQAPLQGDYDVS
ncbi:MAG TPA: hypothetical protein VNO21_01195 [Polyangiaceae bacterium]|nr:hypothetical protein [Polyangiaceae bacterium]